MPWADLVFLVRAVVKHQCTVDGDKRKLLILLKLLRNIKLVARVVVGIFLVQVQQKVHVVPHVVLVVDVVFKATPVPVKLVALDAAHGRKKE